MTPRETGLLREAARMGCYGAAVAAQWRRMRAEVRTRCGYTPAVLRAMSWQEMRDAYADCLLMENRLKDN